MQASGPKDQVEVGTLMHASGPKVTLKMGLKELLNA